MEIKALPNNVRDKIRSGMKIPTLLRCVEELVFNSLDAKSTAIAIRIHLNTYKIQIIDNGNGISKSNLINLGLRHATSKCKNLNDLEKKPKYYGYKGESLANLLEISKNIYVISRPLNVEETFCINLKTRDLERVKTRPSKGTTITIEDFLYNLPIRKTRTCDLDLNEIKNELRALSLLHYNVTITLRNEINKEILFDNQRKTSVGDCLVTLSNQLTIDDLIEVRGNIKKGRKLVTILGLISKKVTSKTLQYIYVNKRHVSSHKLHNNIRDLLSKSSILKTKNDDYCYVICIKCPYNDIDYLYETKKTIAIFDDWNFVEEMLKKYILKALTRNGLIDAETPEVVTAVNMYDNDEPSKQFGISQISGAVKSGWIKKRQLFEEGQSNANKCDEQTKKKKMTVKKRSSGLNQNVTKEVVPQKIDKRRVKSFFNEYNLSQKTSKVGKKYGNTQSLVLNSDLLSPLGQNLSKYEEDENKKEEPTICQRLVARNIELRTIRQKEPAKNDEKFKEQKLNKQANCQIFVESPSSSQICDGKGIIMDIFLKSTVVYNDYENNGITKQHNATMTMSYVQTKTNCHSKKSFSTTLTSGVDYRKSVRNCGIQTDRPILASKSIQATNGSKQNNRFQTEYPNSAFKTKKKQKIVTTQKFDSHGNSGVPPKHRVQNDDCGNNLETAKKSVHLLENVKVREKMFPRTIQSEGDDFEQFRKNLVGNYNCDSDSFIKELENVEQCNNNKTNENKENLRGNAKKNVYPKGKLKKSHNAENVSFPPPLRNNPMIAKKIKENSLKIVQKKDLEKLKQKQNNKNCCKIYLNNWIKENFDKKKHSEIKENPEFYKTFVSHNYPLDCENLDAVQETPNSSKTPRTPPNDNILNENLQDHLDNTTDFLENQYESLAGKYTNVRKNFFETYNFHEECSNYQKNQYDLTERSAILTKTSQHLTFHKNIKKNPDFSRKLFDFSKKPCSLFFQKGNRTNEIGFKKDATKSKVFHEKSKKPQQENQNLHQNSPKVIANNTSTDIMEITNNTNYTENNENDIIIEDTFQDYTIPTHNINLFTPGQENLSLNEQFSGTIILPETPDANTNIQTQEVFDVSKWIKMNDHQDNDKAFYINKKTGMSYNCTPIEVGDNFKLKKRMDFIPKGLSPILNEIKTVDVSLSPNSKGLLLEALIPDVNELGTIKWTNYLANIENPSEFFDLIYREKCKKFENLIPDVSKTLENSIKIEKTIFNNLTIIGQWDCKFIVAKSEDSLFLLDQHAVDERIRLENLLKDPKIHENHIFKSTKYKKQMQLTMNAEDVRLLETFESIFRKSGLKYKVISTTIVITDIPTCLYNKCDVEKNQGLLEQFIIALIEEQLNMLKTTRGVASSVPNIIRNVLNLEACRGAIKFGDKLTMNDCKCLLKKLSKCDMPFQCAHGRPTIVPLLQHMDTVKNRETKKPNLNQIKVWINSMVN